MSHLEILEEACEALPHTTRAMFGGHGLFAPHGGIFAAVVEDGLILKFADDAAREELVALGGAPWTYAQKMTMREWIVVPESFYDEPHTLRAWAARAHRLAPPKAAKKGKAAGPARKASARRRGS